jgi:anthranilate phosphoribosyltransferase
LRGESLAEAEAAASMRSIFEGEATPAQIGGFLMALRAKGETVDEIVGFARTMRDLSRPVHVDGPIVDTCGTGGDRAGTINISTMAAIVAAGAGARVAKHGNRAASSRCGSADLLEALGVAIDLEPDDVAACIDEVGLGFCFAPLFHPAMRHAAVPRRELGVPTVFNFLGPLTNPAGARRQTVGVSDQTMAPKIAHALKQLGAERALVFRGHDGLDELTTTGPSTLWEIGADVRERAFAPDEAGVPIANLADLAGAGPEENAKICESVLAGEKGPPREAVALNAGAALVVVGLASDIVEGVERARASIDSGAAGQTLERLRSISQTLKTRT